jgi:serine/threonine-protein phosphatase PP1 catalytic subunit
MGQTPSKRAEKGGAGSASGSNNASASSLERASGEGFDSYPFSKSDTKESTRSIRSLRSKIPGSGKSSGTDSPKASSSTLTGPSSAGTAGVDKSDAVSVKSSGSAKSGATRSGRGSTAQTTGDPNASYPVILLWAWPPISGSGAA